VTRGGATAISSPPLAPAKIIHLDDAASGVV